MTEKRKLPKASDTSVESVDSVQDDDVIRIEDLAPPDDVLGGRKILLGEIHTPLNNPRILPGS